MNNPKWGNAMSLVMEYLAHSSIKAKQSSLVFLFYEGGAVRLLGCGRVFLGGGGGGILAFNANQ